MTLYVNEPKYDGMGVDAKRPASLRERLTARGWVQCGSCGGNGRVPDRSIPTDYPCPDCVEGLVPPEGMVEATARSLCDDDGIWNSQYRQGYLAAARSALIAAARWEREQ